jgi:hypothetical protein
MAVASLALGAVALILLGAILLYLIASTPGWPRPSPLEAVLIGLTTFFAVVSIVARAVRSLGRRNRG